MLFSEEENLEILNSLYQMNLLDKKSELEFFTRLSNLKTREDAQLFIKELKEKTSSIITTSFSLDKGNNSIIMEANGNNNSQSIIFNNAKSNLDKDKQQIIISNIGNFSFSSANGKAILSFSKKVTPKIEHLQTPREINDINNSSINIGKNVHIGNVAGRDLTIGKGKLEDNLDKNKQHIIISNMGNNISSAIINGCAVFYFPKTATPKIEHLKNKKEHKIKI